MDKIFVQVSPVAPACVCGYSHGNDTDTLTITIPTSRQLLVYCYDNNIKTVLFTGNFDYVNGYIEKIKTEELTTYNENKIEFVNIMTKNEGEY